MKAKHITTFIFAVVLLFIVYTASQSLISMVSRVGECIPADLVSGDGYKNHLKSTLDQIDNYNFEELRQRYKEDTEWKLRYIDVMQCILKRLAKVKAVDS